MEHSFRKMGQQRPLLKNGPTPASLYLFSNKSLTENNCKLQWDSNSDRSSSEEAQWPLDNQKGPNNRLFYLQFSKKFDPVQWKINVRRGRRTLIGQKTLSPSKGR